MSVLEPQLTQPTEIPSSDPFRVRVESFEGPLDLLLYLIKKDELDITEVSLRQIADPYLEYVRNMVDLDLELAGEFILVAATLMLIKSRALLSDESESLLEEDEDLESPEELIRRLLEYKKYKDAAQEFKSRNTLYQTVFPRLAQDPILAQFRKSESPLEVSVDELVTALEFMFKQVRLGAVHEVKHESITIGQRIRQIIEKLRVRADLRFEELFETTRGRYWVIVSFLSILEMARLSLLRIYQTDPNGTIRIQSRLHEASAENVQERLHVLIDEEETMGYGGQS